MSGRVTFSVQDLELSDNCGTQDGIWAIMLEYGNIPHCVLRETLKTGSYMHNRSATGINFDLHGG